MKVVYMMITNDKYELPLAVADSVGELAEMVGTTRNCILSAISHAKRKARKSSYIRVEIEEGEEE